MQAHDDAQEDHPDLIKELRDDLCPACVFREHRRSCYVCRVRIDDSGLHQSLYAQNSLPQADGKFYYYLIYPEFQIFPDAASPDVHSGISDSGFTDFESVTLSPSTQVSSIIGQTVTSTESVTVQLADSPVWAPQAQKVAAPLPHALEQAAAPPVAQVLHAPQAASSASSRWYTVTAGHVTGVFQGW
jgi:hypothetical protein